MQNLIIKALELTERGKVITILVKPGDKLETLESTLEFSVVLQGNLLTSDEISNLYDVSDDRKIGLHVAKLLCQKLGGELEVTSSRGATSFFFSIMCKQYLDTSSTMVNTLSRVDSNMALSQLSHIMVITESVIDCYAIKYTLCQLLKLGSNVNFVS